MPVAWSKPYAWFVKELRLINPELRVAWNNRAKRWLIYNPDGSVSHRVEHPRTKAYRDLDRRILRKIQVDTFFTHNDAALQKYIQEDNHGLRAYLTRGLDGLSDYLSGFDKN